MNRHALTPHTAASAYWPTRAGYCRRRCILQSNQSLDQGTAPLLDAVLARGNQLETPLHVPGHKRGRAVDPGMQQLMQAAGVPASHGQPPPPPDADAAGCADSPLCFDLTELAGLDYLSSPSSVIKAAQELAAAAFTCQHTWFLVNGCSVAVHAAVMATVKPGQALLLARNCHLSAFSACVLSDAVPVWLQPEQDSLHDIAHCITPRQLQHGFDVAKARGLDVGAVLVVSPTYYGAVARVSELADLCHKHGVPLLVDEAHGGHLSPLAKGLQDRSKAASGTPTTAADASPGLSTSPHAQYEDMHAPGADTTDGSTQVSAVPLSAVDAGADVVMHSTHKVLTAMTQAAMLHLCSDALVAPSKISKALQVLQTSSPSYILLASLDAARRHAFTPGVWQEPLAAADAARGQLAQLPGLSLLQDGSCGCQESVLGFDPCRLVLNVSSLGVKGFAAAAWLEEQNGIVPELATNKLVVFVFGPGSTQADASKLVDACRQLSSANIGMLATQPLQMATPASPTPTCSPACSSEGTAAFQEAKPSAAEQPPLEQENRQKVAAVAALTPRQAFFADNEAVALRDAVGRVSAELLCPYPPGVPVVFPGECFTAANVQQLQETLASGGVVTGGQDSMLQTVLVVTKSN